MLRNGRKAAFRIGAFACIVLVLLSCRRADLLVISDQYWEATDLGPDTKKMISEAREESIEFKTVTYPTDVETLAAELGRAGASTVLLSPLHSSYASRLQELPAGTRIIAFETARRRGGENISYLSFGRRAAYMRAGSVCRRFLDAPDNQSSKVAAFFYSGGAERDAERRAFLDGLGEPGSERVYIRTFPRIDALGEVNEALAVIREDDIGLFFVSMAGLSKDVVANVSSQLSALVITEGVGPDIDAAYGDRVVASIENDWISAVFSSFSGPEGQIKAEAVLIPGPAAQTTGWLTGL